MLSTYWVNGKEYTSHWGAAISLRIFLPVRLSNNLIQGIGVPGQTGYARIALTGYFLKSYQPALMSKNHSSIKEKLQVDLISTYILQF